MTRHRFFIPPENFSAQTAWLPAGTRDQIAKVLRLGEGAEIELLDGRGNAFLAILKRGQDGGLFASIVAARAVESEPRTQLTLYFGLTQREKLEWILQKGTEIGIAVFQPFISKRTLVRDEASAQKKRARWEGILREAAEQSGRGRVPELRDPLGFMQALEHSGANQDLTLACWVHEKQKNLKDALSDSRPARVGLFTGPEGGFAPQEVDELIGSGARMISLGPRVLRMETAAILAPALVLYELGEMNAPEDLKNMHIQ
jgi:16S rRNA (uracil1498-N3)-methyltransferase